MYGLALPFYVYMPVAGLVGAGERVGEDPGGDQGAQRRHSAIAEPRAAGGGADHGFSEPQELHPHPGDLHDRADDDHYTADAVRQPARLHPQRTRQHRVTGPPQLVHADCPGQCSPTFTY